MPLLRYSLLRLLTLVASLAVLYLVGLRGWVWLLVSVIVAAAVSYLLLARPRDAAARALAERANRPAKPLVAGVDESVEDAVVDSAGPDSAGPDSAGPDSAGPDSVGPVSAGPDSADPEPAAEAAAAAPPQPERERDGHHELEPTDVAQHADERRTGDAVPDEPGERERDR